MRLFNDTICPGPAPKLPETAKLTPSDAKVNGKLLMYVVPAVADVLVPGTIRTKKHTIRRVNIKYFPVIVGDPTVVKLVNVGVQVAPVSPSYRLLKNKTHDRFVLPSGPTI